jgi:thiosulfate/3-mercaptopyruvate sulfurtransferase
MAAMKTNTILPLLMLALALGLGAGNTGCQAAKQSWTDQDLKDPAALAAVLTATNQPKPVILNIGPVEQIKGAIEIGPATVPDNLTKLQEQMAKSPRNGEVVIYCGCCPFRTCPNLKPAYQQLKQMQFTNVKLLNLPSNLKEDWINKGYPMD